MLYEPTHPSIIRIPPSEIIIGLPIYADQKDLEGRSFHTTYKGSNVIAQMMRRPNETEKNRANAYHLMQGVCGVPKLHGVVEGTDGVSGLENVRMVCEKYSEGIVIVEKATGKGLTECPEYFNPTVARIHNYPNKADVYSLVADSIERYLKESLERELFDWDLPARDVFLDSTYGRVMKVDQANVEYTQNNQTPDMFNHAGGYLMCLLPQIVDIVRRGDRNFLDSINKLLAEDLGNELSAEGLKTLPEFLKTYQEEFAALRHKPGRYVSQETFTEFLSLWVQAMQENGRYLLSK